MEEFNPKKAFHKIQNILNGIMLALYLPVLFCVMFIGNKMDYFDDVKARIWGPNVIWSLLALAAVFVCLRLIKLGEKISLTKRVNLYLNWGLVILFAGFYFFCMWLSREVMFDMSVDQGICREAAKEVAAKIPFGYRYDFSLNHNNLPIMYVLGILYRMAGNWTWFRHDPQYLWIIIGCLMVTAAGFCSCQIVKRLTRNVAAVLLTFALYFATAGICPWKYIPYTDSYGILFPVLCFLLYLYSLDCKGTFGRGLLLFLALLSGTYGAFIKPSAYIAVLAVIGLEGAHFLAMIVEKTKRYGAERENESGENIRSAGLFLLFSLFLAGALYLMSGFCKSCIIKEMGLDYNPGLAATPQYFFFMGTNELTTGSFSVEDFGIVAEFQDDLAARNAACIERGFARMKSRGVAGTLYFWLKKLVRSFNDGSFSWTHVLYNEPFPEDLTHANFLADYMRSLFVPGGANQWKYETLAELVWIFTLMGVPGIALSKGRRDFYAVFPILVSGVLVYLMLFESGARYVYIFLPVFVVMSVCGMELIQSFWSGIRKTH